MGQAIFLALPVFVETTLVDPLLQRHLPKTLPLGLAPSDIKFKVEKIGLTHTLVSHIHIGQMLSANLLDFQYHLKGLKSVELEKITISGLTLYAKMDADNQLRINGKKFPGNINPGQEDDSAQKDKDPQKVKETLESMLVNLDSFLDFLPKQAVLKDATLSITRLDDKIIIPFEILSSLDTLKKKIVLNARFYPLGQTIKTLIAGDLMSGIEMVKIQSPAFHPEVLTGFFPEVGNFRVSGPVDIDILKKMDTSWQLSLSQIKLDFPNLSGTRIENLTASVGIQAGKISAEGGFDLAGSLSPALGMRFDLNLDQKENSTPFFDLTIENKAVDSISLVTSPQGIRFNHPHLLFSLKGNLARQTGKFLLGCQNLMATQREKTVLVKNFSLNSGIKGDFSDKGKGLDLDVQSSLSGIKIRSNAGQAEIMTLKLTGRAGVTKQMDPLIHLDTRINDAKIDLSEFKISAMGIDASFPLVFPFNSETIGGTVSVEKILYNNQYIALGRAKTERSDLRQGKELLGDLRPIIGMEFYLKYHQKETTSPFFDLTIKNKEANEIFLSSESQEMRFKDPTLLLTLKGNYTRQAGTFLLGCEHLTATQDNNRLFVNNFLLTSGIKGDFSDKANKLTFDLKTDLSRIDVFSKSTPTDVAGGKISGRGGITKKNAPAEFKMTALGIHAKLPLTFPFKNENTPGTFSINEISYNNQIAASLGGNITQSEMLGVTLKGQASIKGLDGFNLMFDGKVWGADPSARIDFLINPFLLMPTHIKKIMPRLTLGENSSINVSSKGTIEYKHHGVKSRASVMMDGGNLFFPDMNLSLKGIAGSIDFNDLMVPESIPGQVLTIDKVNVNQFEFDTARLRFSIEDGKSVNIENLRFNWCNGLVSTESIRLPGKDNVLSLILYCDRLELSALLKQMGAFHAEGEGRLSGRIPLVYSDGNISFDKGFLFSTPGKGGRVVIENTKTLTAGIPMDTPEFVQLDLAREALKDFDYQWAKLELNTFEDTLDMKLELDGKPAKLLPFEYQQEIGSFVRVDATSPGSKFQGIKLNVNLKLPFNQVLKFGNKLNDIFN
jgi:hypothetical protein